MFSEVFAYFFGAETISNFGGRKQKNYKKDLSIYENVKKVNYVNSNKIV